MSDVNFNVRVSKGNGDYLVTVDLPDGSEYAKTLCTSLDTALKMAVPYMVCATEPDPFAALLGDEVDVAIDDRINKVARAAKRAVELPGKAKP